MIISLVCEYSEVIVDTYFFLCLQGKGMPHYFSICLFKKEGKKEDFVSSAPMILQEEST